MKNEYVGDINDFAKFGLLRCLAVADASKAFRLGVLWYWTVDKKKDGGLTSYLKQPRASVFEPLNPELHQQLRTIVEDKDRRVQRVQEDHVLPEGTKYWGAEVNHAKRSEWFTKATEALSDADLIFLDPDNGLAPDDRATAMHARESEASRFLGDGKSVVSIQFFRRTPHDDQARKWMRLSTTWTHGRSHSPIALRWHRERSIGFLILPANANHAKRLRDRVDSMLLTDWRKHFTLLCLP